MVKVLLRKKSRIKKFYLSISIVSSIYFSNTSTLSHLSLLLIFLFHTFDKERKQTSGSNQNISEERINYLSQMSLYYVLQPRNFYPIFYTALYIFCMVGPSIDRPRDQLQRCPSRATAEFSKSTPGSRTNNQNNR